MLNYKINWLNPKTNLYDSYYKPNYFTKENALVVNKLTNESKVMIISPAQWIALRSNTIDSVFDNQEYRNFFKQPINKNKQLKFKYLLDQVEIV